MKTPWFSSSCALTPLAEALNDRAACAPLSVPAAPETAGDAVVSPVADAATPATRPSTPATCPRTPGVDGRPHTTPKEAS